MEQSVFKAQSSGFNDDTSRNSMVIKKSTLSFKGEDDDIQVKQNQHAMDKLMANNAMGVMKNIKFKEIFKNQFDQQGYDQLYQDDPMYIYQKRVQEEKDVMLPLVNKVKDKTLVLQDYTLNSSHCIALAEAWIKTGRPEVEIVFLDNCGVDDEEFSYLLNGFMKIE